MLARVLFSSIVTTALAGSALLMRADVFDMPDEQTSLQFVTVGDPGNVADTVAMNDGTTGYGSVDHTYQMGKYDVTTAQYCQFLNAVAATDTYSLWNGGMASKLPTVGISRSGNEGNYRYAVIGSGNIPIFNVTWSSAARFCNWLQNRQPIGPAGPGTTETGAYSINGVNTTADLMAISRNPGAVYFLPSENEWYKAAYYRGGNRDVGYWLYPTQNDAVPGNALPDYGNSANFYSNGYTDPTNYLTPVGAFAESPGAYGTFDQGGDVWQWNEATVTSTGRGLRGGCFASWRDSTCLAASYRSNSDPLNELVDIGFRVASVPEPSCVPMVLIVALVGLLYAVRYR